MPFLISPVFFNELSFRFPALLQPWGGFQSKPRPDAPWPACHLLLSCHPVATANMCVHNWHTLWPAFVHPLDLYTSVKRPTVRWPQSPKTQSCLWFLTPCLRRLPTNNQSVGRLAAHPHWSFLLHDPNGPLLEPTLSPIGNQPFAISQCVDFTRN